MEIVEIDSEKSQRSKITCLSTLSTFKDKPLNDLIGSKIYKKEAKKKAAILRTR